MAPPSSLLLDELLVAGDPRALEELFGASGERRLGGLADKLWADTRPQVRALVDAYIKDGCDRPGHRSLVKRLFKNAERAGDDARMALFAAVVDRLLQRRLVKELVWDFHTTEQVPTWRLRKSTAFPSRSPAGKVRDRKNTKGSIDFGPDGQRFSHRTRLYLTRRAWRYWRNVGRKDPARYRRGMLAVLCVYEDAHLQKPEQLLDAWTLMHALHHHSPVLSFDGGRGLRVADGQNLSSLTGHAPAFPDAWRQPAALQDLRALLTGAQAHPVRRFALDQLRTHHSAGLRALPLAEVLALLQHPHDDVQRLAAELLPNVPGLDNLAVTDWLTLLSTRNSDVALAVVALVRKHVLPARVSLEQCVSLVRAPVAAVAQLGWGWVAERLIADNVESLVPALEAGVASVRTLATAAIVPRLHNPLRVRDALDVAHADVRAATLAHLDAHRALATSPVLWSAMAESPHDDVRAWLVTHLRTHTHTLAAGSLRHVWATALLNVHRGGAHKKRVLQDVAARLQAHPADAAEWVPLLRFALRSVRPHERRSALAVVARAAFETPSLRDALTRHIPELTLFSAESSAEPTPPAAGAP